MAVYDTDLKQEKDGTWYRWIGVNNKGTKQKFRLGKNKTEANSRLRLILSLYEIQSGDGEFYGELCTWLPEHLKAAKQIAKGKEAKLPRVAFPVGNDQFIQESPETYAKAFAHVNREVDAFLPADPSDFNEAVEAIDADQKKNRQIKSKLIGSNPDRDPTGQTLSQALDGHIDHLTTQNTLPDESLSPWGKTQTNQIDSWKNYMSIATETRGSKQVKLKLLKTDLADITIAKAQQMIDAVRNRPLSFESKQTKRLTPKTIENYNKSIKNFFDWLDLSDQWEWMEPPRFRKLKYKAAELTAEEKHEKKLKREMWRISDDEIRILIQYATPVERVLILLGLNCAFGSGEIGNLRIPSIKFDTKEIDGIRFKTGNDSRHHLWEETIEGLQWELGRREQLPKEETSLDIAFLTEQGKPLWRRNKSGNYANGVSARWDNLLDRLQKDHPDFHRYSFGKLRKTAAIRMIELFDAEAASMLLAHGIPSEDKILKAYVNIPWQKLYKAQEAYGETIRHLLQTDRPPFEQPPKNYIGRKAEQAIERYKSGMPVQDIADQLGISKATVHRHIERVGAKRRTKKKT